MYQFRLFRNVGILIVILRQKHYFILIFVGGRDAAINALQKKLAEVDLQRKKELERRESIEAELKSLQDKVCFCLGCDIITKKDSNVWKLGLWVEPKKYK